MWPLRLAIARLRPFNAATITRTLIVLAMGLLFLFGDYALFVRLFRALARAEAETPIFALGLLRNLLSLVFLVASVILFSSSMTTAIGSYFADLDLDLYHAAPRSRLRIAIARWMKTLAQSATIVFLFLIPLFLAFAQQYEKPFSFYPIVLINLALLHYKKEEFAGHRGRDFVGVHHFGFIVDDVAEARQRIEAAGGRHWMGEPAQGGGFYEVKFHDPDGVAFDITANGWTGAKKD